MEQKKRSVETPPYLIILYLTVRHISDESETRTNNRQHIITQTGSAFRSDTGRRERTSRLRALTESKVLTRVDRPRSSHHTTHSSSFTHIIQRINYLFVSTTESIAFTLTFRVGNRHRIGPSQLRLSGTTIIARENILRIQHSVRRDLNLRLAGCLLPTVGISRT